MAERDYLSREKTKDIQEITDMSDICAGEPKQVGLPVHDLIYTHSGGSISVARGAVRRNAARLSPVSRGGGGALFGAP